MLDVFIDVVGGKVDIYVLMVFVVLVLVFMGSVLEGGLFFVMFGLFYFGKI